MQCTTNSGINCRAVYHTTTVPRRYATKNAKCMLRRAQPTLYIFVADYEARIPAIIVKAGTPPKARQNIAHLVPVPSLTLNLILKFEPTRKSSKMKPVQIIVGGNIQKKYHFSITPYILSRAEAPCLPLPGCPSMGGLSLTATTRNKQ